MLTSRVLGWCVFGCLLAACGDSKKAVVPASTAGASGTAGTSGGKGGAGGGGAGRATGGASGSGAMATGGSAGGGAAGGKAGSGGTGGGGTSSGGTGGDSGSAGDASDASGGDPFGGSAGVSGASGAGGEGGGGKLGDDIEGIYTLDDAVQNTGSCDPGGTSVRGAYTATHLVVRSTTIAGTGGDRPALVVTGCSGLAACRTLGAALVDDATTFELIPYYVFTSDEDAGTYTTTTVYYGTLDGTTCRNGGIDLVSLAVTGAALELESRTQRTDYPAVNGTCPPGTAAEQGALAPCTQLRVLTGTRVETF